MPKGFQGKKKGSRAEKIAIAKAQRARKSSPMMRKKLRKTTTKRRKSTRKGMVRKTARRAYTGIKRRVKRRKSKTNKDSMWNW